MAKTLTQFVGDIRTYLAKGKVKAARKAYDKASKAGVSGPALEEAHFELLLAEGGGANAALQLKAIRISAEARLPAAIKHGEAYLRTAKDDHPLRDQLWESALTIGEAETALRHLAVLQGAGAVDGPARAKSMLDRKDAVGAAALFLLASVGAVKTDRIKLADRLLKNTQAASLLNDIVNALHAKGHADGPIHYVLAQVAQSSGDKERFLEYAGRAFEENPDEVWTWTLENVAARDRLEIAVRNDSLKHLIDAAGAAEAKDIVDVANKSAGEGAASRALRGLALLLTKKTPNACRILESLVVEEAASAAPVANLLAAKAGEWPGAREVYASVVGAAFAGDADSVARAVEGLLAVAADERGEAWGRAAPKMLESAPDRHDLRGALGHYHLGAGDQDEAAKLLTSPDHLPVAREWAQSGAAKAPVLLAATGIAEDAGVVADHAEWLLGAARGDTALIGELGRRLSGSNVSPETALQSAATLLDQGQKKEAADMLGRLPLDRGTGELVDKLLSERGLQDDRDFRVVSFRAALALGDQNRARRLFKGDEDTQGVAREASRHADAGRVLAGVLVGAGQGEVAATVLDARRDAGDDAKGLMPLADALIKAQPQLSSARLLRAKLLNAVGRAADAVRDLRAIPADTPETDAAFQLLGELSGDGDSAATLGRADIHIGRAAFDEAVAELATSGAPAADRLERFDRICRAKPDFDAGHKGRAQCLLELKRIPDAAESHRRRFSCADADPAAVATDLAALATAAIGENDIKTACAVLEQLPDQVSDGADRAIRVIGGDQRPPLLILNSKLLLQLGRTDEAVKALADLVAADPDSRPQAAQALEAIIEAGQARPDADFALADAFDAMQRTGDALGALSRLYDDDITSKDNVVAAADKLVRRADDADVRLFLGRVCLDKRDAAGATEHAVAARRLRPAARKDSVALLRKALDLDAFAPETHFALGEAHLAGDEADDAVRHFRAAVEVARERAAPAIKAMEAAAPRSGSPSLLWLAVGTTYAEFSKDHGAAVGAFTKGLEANPPTDLKVPLLLGRGDAYAAQSDDDRAFDDFDEASQHESLERRYYEFLRARHRKRVLDAAHTAKETATASFRDAVDAVGRFVRLGQAQEAVTVAQAALAAAPTDLGPRYLVGVALHAAGGYDAAAQVLEAVRSSAGADTAVGRAARMLLAESYLDSGDRPRARTCLTEIESVDAAYPGLRARRAALAPPADDPHAPPPLFVRPEFPRPTE